MPDRTPIFVRTIKLDADVRQHICALLHRLYENEPRCEMAVVYDVHVGEGIVPPSDPLEGLVRAGFDSIREPEGHPVIRPTLPDEGEPRHVVRCVRMNQRKIDILNQALLLGCEWARQESAKLTVVEGP